MPADSLCRTCCSRLTAFPEGTAVKQGGNKTSHKIIPGSRSIHNMNRKCRNMQETVCILRKTSFFSGFDHDITNTICEKYIRHLLIFFPARIE